MIREALTLERLRALDPEEAAALFVARGGEGLTPSEEELLAAWLAAHEEHGRALRRVERACDWLGDASGHEVIDAMRAHALAPRQRPSWWSRPAVAAAVLLLLLGTLGLVFRGPGWVPGTGGTPGPAEAPMIAYVSAPGQVRTVTLPDGSRMTLDAGTRVLGRFGESGRFAELVQGRAFFAVSSDPRRPFSVTAGERRVVAIGTRFDVGLAEGTLTVNLFEGRVTVGPVTAGIESVTLKPGQQFVERGGSAVVRTIGEEIEDQAGWTRGRLHFDDVTLAEAVAQVNRYAPGKIVIRDASVAEMRISGEFEAGDASRFASTVAELRPVRVVPGPQGIELVASR